MGGERETNVKTKTAGPVGSTKVDALRIHESGGEVHFHDDVNKLKVAVPVATWFSALENLHALGEQGWLFLDAVNGTSLEVSLTVDSDGKQPVFDVDLLITKIKVANDLAKLLKFTHGS